MRTRWLRPLDDLGSCLRQLAEHPHPFRALGTTFGALFVTWFLYVPIHELLHVAGCVLTGGSVTKLEIAPQYGGTLLARWFPFVVSGGEYAGRLSGWDTKGSDLIYLATDFTPFLLTVLLGVALLVACTRRPRPILFGSALVIGLAPFTNLIGDYYEMGSVITTRIVTLLMGSKSVAFVGIRSDDIFKLIGEICTQPGELGLHGWAQVTVGSILVLVSLLTAVGLALMTYAAGRVFSRVVYRQRTQSHQPPGQ